MNCISLNAKTSPNINTQEESNLGSKIPRALSQKSPLGGSNIALAVNAVCSIRARSILLRFLIVIVRASVSYTVVVDVARDNVGQGSGISIVGVDAWGDYN